MPQIEQHSTKFKPSRSRRLRATRSLRRIENTTETFAKIVTNVTKVFAFFALPGGAFIVWVYLASVGAPFAFFDAATVGVIAAAFAIVTFVIAGFLTVPMYAKLFSPNGAQGNITAFQPTATRRYVWHYVFTFTPFLLFWVGAYFASISPSGEWPVTTAVTLQLLPFGLFLVGLAVSLAYHHEVHGPEKAIGYMRYCAVLNFFGLVWAGMLLPLVEKVLSCHAFFQENRALALLIVFALFVALHAFLSRGEAKAVSWAVGTIGIGVLLTMILGPAHMGGAALRILGVGGGIPASLQLKKPDHAPRQTGCLILLTPTTVYWRPLTAAESPAKCNQEFRFFPEFGDNLKALSVNIISRADAASIGPWLDPERHPAIAPMASVGG